MSESTGIVPLCLLGLFVAGLLLAPLLPTGAYVVTVLCLGFLTIVVPLALHLQRQRDIAFFLQYSEPAAFTRSFRRWTGQTPRAFRHS